MLDTILLIWKQTKNKQTQVNAGVQTIAAALLDPIGVNMLLSIHSVIHIILYINIDHFPIMALFLDFVFLFISPKSFNLNLS